MDMKTHQPPSPLNEIEVLREAFEQRNEDFLALADMPLAEQLECIGRSPPQPLLRLLERELERRRTQKVHNRSTDIEEACWDAMGLAARSIYGPLTDAETWRLLYRLAYLQGYDIHLAWHALASHRRSDKQRRQRGGQSVRKYHRPYKAKALNEFRALRDSTYQLNELVEIIHEQLPEGAARPNHDTLRRWLQPHWKWYKSRRQKMR